MFAFSHKTKETHDTLTWRLLDAPSRERQFVLLTALHKGELSVSEAADVLLLVSRIESLSQPIHRRQMAAARDADPSWQRTGNRYTF